jgi:hypothetical protein
MAGPRGSPWDRGYMSVMDLIMDGVAVTRNPYAEGTSEHDEWEHGCADAWEDEMTPGDVA